MGTFLISPRVPYHLHRSSPGIRNIPVSRARRRAGDTAPEPRRSRTGHRLRGSLRCQFGARCSCPAGSPDRLDSRSSACTAMSAAALRADRHAPRPRARAHLRVSHRVGILFIGQQPLGRGARSGACDRPRARRSTRRMRCGKRLRRSRRARSRLPSNSRAAAGRASSQWPWRSPGAGGLSPHRPSRSERSIGVHRRRRLPHLRRHRAQILADDDAAVARFGARMPSRSSKG
jgi:hypothetical protein